MGLGVAPRAGAAQGPHGEDGGGAGVERPGVDGAEVRTGAGDTPLAGCPFWWFGGRAGLLLSSYSEGVKHAARQI